MIETTTTLYVSAMDGHTLSLYTNEDPPNGTDRCKLNIGEAKALISRLRSVRRATTPISIAFGRLIFNTRIEEHPEAKKLRLENDAILDLPDGPNVLLPPDNAEALADLIDATMIKGGFNWRAKYNLAVDLDDI